MYFVCTLTVTIATCLYWKMEIQDGHFLPAAISFDQSHTSTVNTLYFSSMSDEP